MGRGLAMAILPAILVVGCTLLPNAAELPDQHQLATGQLVIHSNFRLARQHRLLDELTALRGDIYSQLALPASDEPIHVFLFDAAGVYRSYLRSQLSDLPERRALFVETDTRLSVYAYWGDFVAEDLRHEVTHGYLHAVVPQLPLWVDEGLAEYYELPRGRQGYHAAHIATLRRATQERRWAPDLLRLEGLSSMAEMSLQDYAESWLWMHFLLNTTPARRELVRAYLQELRLSGQAPPLSYGVLRMESDPAAAVSQHLAQLAELTAADGGAGTRPPLYFAGLPIAARGGICYSDPVPGNNLSHPWRW